ncbi:MAG: peptidylprolyl isomerase [Pseudomonadota bacterium]
MTVAAIGLLATGAVLSAQETNPDDPIVATVNGEPVHLAEVEALRRTLPPQMQQQPPQLTYGILLDRVIDFRLLAEEAERSDIAEDPEAIEALAEARAAVLRDVYLQREIEEATTDEKVRARFDEMKSEEGFAHEEVRARHILLESEEDAKAVIEEIDGGADFAEVAKERSTGPSGPNGGDLGFIRKDQVVPEFGDAAFALQPEETTKEPVQTQFGWHVIEVLERKRVEPTFEETAPQLRQEMAREVVSAMVDDLRADATIERFNPDGSPMEE